MNRAIDDVDGKVDGFKSKLGSVAKVAAAAGVAALGTELFAAGKAFAEDEKQAQALALTLKNVADVNDDGVKAVEKMINATQNATGVLDDELRPAMDSLVRGTGSVKKSQELLALALDVSTGTGKPLVEVADALSKAYNGNTKSLKALDPQLKNLITEGATTQEIFDNLGQTFSGQTAAAAETTAGKIAIMKARFSDLQEEIGAKVVPIMAALAEFISTKLIPTIERIVHWLEEHKGVAIALGVAVATVLVAAFIAWAAAAISAAAATIAAAAPVIAITVAIAALAAGIIYAYTHWGWFKTAVDAVGEAIQVVFNWIKDHWELVLGILTGPFGPAVVLIIKNFDTIKDTFADVIGFFVHTGEVLYSAIKGPFERAFKWVKEVYDHSIGPIITAIQDFSFGPGSGGFGGGLSAKDVKPPGRASGGPTSPYGAYTIGENGPETLVMGRNPGMIIPNGAGMGGNTVVYLTVQGNVLSERDLIGKIQDAVRRGYGG